MIQGTPELDWLLLTKRPQNIAKFTAGVSWPFPNVWLGVSAEDQRAFDKRWPILAKVEATVRFVSYEPAIGPLKLSPKGPLPDWLICGGETGTGARTMKRRWARDLLQECEDLGVQFFLKQMTDKAPIPADLLVRQYPRG